MAANRTATRVCTRGEAMNWKGWLKTLGVAAAGGALTGGLAALLDPSHFSFKDWIDEEHVAEMAAEGAAIAAGAFLLKSPMGQKLLHFAHEAQEQAAADQRILKDTLQGLKTDAKTDMAEKEQHQDNT